MLHAGTTTPDLPSADTATLDATGYAPCTPYPHESTNCLTAAEYVRLLYREADEVEALYSCSPLASTAVEALGYSLDGAARVKVVKAPLME